MVVLGLGPACNLVVAGACFGLYYLLPLQIRAHVFSLRNHIIALNLLLLANVLPVFPLDGGRLLKEFLLELRVRPEQIVLCLRSAALFFGARTMVVLIRFSIWSDWLLWGLVLVASLRVLGNKKTAMEELWD